MNNLQLDWKRISCFHTDNANGNSRIRHSLYTNILIALNQSIVTANFNAPTVQNITKCVTENLNVDTENIVLKYMVMFQC